MVKRRTEPGTLSNPPDALEEAVLLRVYPANRDARARVTEI